VEKNKYFQKKLKAIEVKKKNISQLLDEMADTGFQGRKLGEVVRVWEKMLKDKNLTIFMGYAGSLSTTGQWKIVKWLIENRLIDVLVSTGANISEDIQDALGYGYWKGSPNVDDKDLLKKNIFRYYDVFTDAVKYRQMTALIRRFINSLGENYIYSTREFCYLFGKFLTEKKINCILSTAYRKKVPVFSPGIMDSEYGIAAVLAKRKDKKNIIVDQIKDFDELAKIGEKSKKTGAIYIGGGVPKDYTQLLTAIVALLKGSALEFPHRYAIQITTDNPVWGGLSGCTFDEAISWGKIAKEGKFVQCYCDATIALPIVSHCLCERINFKRKGPDFSVIF